MLLSWYKNLNITNYTLSGSINNRRTMSIALFNPKLFFKIPNKTTQQKQFFQTKTYFWYLFLLLYKKPLVKKFKWSWNLKHEELLSKETIMTTGTAVYKHRPHDNHVFQNFFQKLKYVNFKPKKKILNFQKDKILFKIWDSPYTPSILDKTKLIDTYNFPFIYLKYYIFNKVCYLIRRQLLCLFFINAFQIKNNLRLV